MLPAYLTIEFSLTELCALLLQTSDEILRLEQNTGLSAWEWVHEHEIPGGHVPSNYEYTSKRLSVHSGKVTHICFRLRTIREYNKSILRIAERHKSKVKDTAAKGRCEEVEEILSIMSEYIEVRLHKADSLQQRLDNQVSGISTIISQRDMSAMKTVAMVTMAFLPGTFVASFFSMPMLNWDATTYNEIVSPRFWIYWMITVPLTMAVFAVYLAITRHQPNNIGGGILTFYLIGTAWLTARRRDGETSRLDWVLLLIPLVDGILIWMTGLRVLRSGASSQNGVPVGMILFMGSVCLLAAAGDVRMLVRGGVAGVKRISRHLWRMCFGLFIAAGSFFFGGSNRPLRLLSTVGIGMYL